MTSEGFDGGENGDSESERIRSVRRFVDDSFVFFGSLEHWFESAEKLIKIEVDPEVSHASIGFIETAYRQAHDAVVDLEDHITDTEKFAIAKKKRRELIIAIIEREHYFLNPPDHPGIKE